MDPNANLQELMVLAHKTQIIGDEQSIHAIDRRDAFRLAELVLALDAWITNGGFLPDRWKESFVVAPNHPEEGF